jgi:hypothetical protein
LRPDYEAGKNGESQYEENRERKEKKGERTTTHSTNKY